MASMTCATAKKRPRVRRMAPGGKEICWEHNYNPEGCVEGRMGRPCLPGQQGRCPFDHDHCHACGAWGHSAARCVQGGQLLSDGSHKIASAGVGVGAEDLLLDTTCQAGSCGDDDGFIFAIGGRNRGKTVGMTDRFSVADGRWEEWARMNEPRGSLGAASLHGAIVAVAGSGITSNLASCEVCLDPSGDPPPGSAGGDLRDGPGGKRDTTVDSGVKAAPATTTAVCTGHTSGPSPPRRPYWHLKLAPSVQTARHALSVVSAGNERIYAVGGWQYGDQASGAVECLDASTLLRAAAAASDAGPAPLSMPPTTSIGDSSDDLGAGAHVQGGVAVDLPSAKTSLTTDHSPFALAVRSAGEWRHCAPLKTARKLHGVAYTSSPAAPSTSASTSSSLGTTGSLFVFGGLGVGSHAPLASAERYDEDTNTWRAIAPLPVAACCCACTVRVREDGAAGREEKEEAAPTRKGSGEGCEEGLTGLTGIAEGGSIFDPAAVPPLRKADKKEDEEEGKLAGVRAARHVVREDVYVVPWGGAGRKGKKKDARVLRYDPVTDTYQPRARLPLADWFGFAVAALGPYIYVAGGSTLGRWTGSFYRYSTLTDTWTVLPSLRAARRRLALVAVPVARVRTVDAAPAAMDQGRGAPGGTHEES